MNNKAKFLNINNLHGSEIFYVLSEVDKHYPLHFHEFFEIELPVEGEGSEEINGARYEIKHNTVFLFHPTDYHEIFATKPLKIINIAFSQSVIDEEMILKFLDYENEIVIELSENKLRQVKATLEVIKEIFYGRRTYKEEILAHLLNALLMIIIGSNAKEVIVSKKSSASVDVLKYINLNFAKNPTLEELSAYCGYQKNYFCDFFKKQTGVTCKEYVSRVKIEHAKKLLKLTSKPIKEIAIECGFNSANNFIRKFREHTKLTPKHYRKLYLDSRNS